MREKLTQLAPLLVVVAALLLPSAWWRIELLFNPIDSGALCKEDVTLYTTAWCQYCAKTRDFLRSAGVPFTEWDIEKSPRAYQRYQQIGGRGVPVAQIGPTIIEGYDKRAIRNAIDTLNQAKQ